MQRPPEPAASTGELDPRRWLALGVIAVAQLVALGNGDSSPWQVVSRRPVR